MAYEIRRQRRHYSKAFKRRVVAETLEAGASVSTVAHRHGLNANMVFMWRWDPRYGPGRELASFHPVEVTRTQLLAPLSEVRAEAGGRIEMVLQSGGRLVLSGTFDADAMLRLARDLCV